MVAQLNHTIVAARDKHESATFLSEILGLPAPQPFGHFLVVPTGNDVSLDFADADGEIAGQHYAFLITEDRVRRGLRPRAGARHHLSGRIRGGATRARSTTTTVAAGSTSRIRAATTSRC